MSETALALNKITAVELFKPGASRQILDKTKEEARALAATFDVSTPEGEAGLKSLAALLGRTKQDVNRARIALVADEKKRLKVIDTEGGIIWDELEALQKEVRQPVTDLEDARKARIAGHEAALSALVESGAYVERNWQAMSVEEVRGRLAEITNSQRDWQEFLARARQACATTIGQIKTAIAQREKLDADAAELEALRAAAALQAQRDRDEQIAREAREAEADRARQIAAEREREAAAERQRIEDERIQAEARAKQAEAQRAQEAAAAEKELQATQERARQAEAQRVEAEERAAREAEEAAQRHAEAVKAEQESARKAKKEASEALALAERKAAEAKAQAEQERKDAELREAAARQAAFMVAEANAKAAAEKAEAERKASVEAERILIEAERQAEAERIAEETRKREANIKHRAKINNEAKHAIAATCNLTDEQAMSVVVAIAKGLILHTKISY